MTNATNAIAYPNAELREYGVVGTGLSMSVIYNASASSQSAYRIIDKDGDFLPALVPHVGTVSDSYTLAANSFITGETVSAAKTGYVPVGILGFNQTGTGSTVCMPYAYYLNGSTITYSMRNVSTSTAASPTITFRVLYFPNSWFGTTVPSA